MWLVFIAIQEYFSDRNRYGIIQDKSDVVEKVIAYFFEIF